MEGLIDFILSNPFLIILLIGGLYSLFKRKTEEPESQEEPSRPRPRPVETRMESKQERPQRPSRQPQQVKERIETRTIEDQQQQQLSDLKRRFETSHSTSNHKALAADQIRNRQTNRLVSKYDDQKFKKRFRENVTRSGLINSVIMSEVLGPPRSMKPYEGTPLNRKHQR